MIIVALLIMIFAAISQSSGQTKIVSKPIAAEIINPVKPLAVVTNLKAEAPSVKDRATALLDQAKKNIVVPKAPSAIDLLLSKGKKAKVAPVKAETETRKVDHSLFNPDHENDHERSKKFNKRTV